MMKKYYFLVVALVWLSADIANAQFIDLHNFNNTYGSYPSNNLVRSGKLLFGNAPQGGLFGGGCLFSIDTDGYNYRDIFDFDTSIYSNGFHPAGDLILLGGKLFGSSNNGGVNAGGNIFSIDTSGVGYKDLYDFARLASYTGSINVYQGKIYGMSRLGGTYDSGFVFAMDTDGLNFKDLFDFNGLNGRLPQGNYITFLGGVIYGETYQGGLYDSGVLFSMDTNGLNFKKLMDFNGANGAFPYQNNLTILGGVIYGETYLGGLYDSGNIFAIDTNGMRYRDLHDFHEMDGIFPVGSLVSSGSKLYGNTLEGADNTSYGCLFTIDTNGNNYRILHRGNPSSGGIFSTSLTLSNNTLYGSTEVGGLYNYGTVFSYTFCTVNSNNQPICIATIDTATNKAEVIWGRTSSPPQGGYGTYNIYKDSALSYALTHSQPLNALSEFIDLNSNPSAGPVSYELSTMDSCGESALSLPHTTIYLTVTGNQSAVKLIWTPYVGFTPSVYRIFRGPALNAMVQFDSVPSSVLTFTDSFPHIGYYYSVEAVNPSGTCIPTSSIRGHRVSSAMLSGSFSNGFNSTVLGIENIENSISNFKFYPNPSNGIFALNYSIYNTNNITISIIDELGQTVYFNFESKTAGNYTKQLNLDNLASGIYFLRLLTNSENIVRKLVILKNK